MKKARILPYLTFLLFYLFFIPHSFAQSTTTTKKEKDFTAPIQSVTVYQQGAQITRQSKVELDKGETILVLKSLSAKIDEQSIQVKADEEGITIVSVVHSLDYLNPPLDRADLGTLEVQQKNLSDSIKLQKKLLAVYAQEREMILANKSIGGEDGVNIADLERAATFFRQRLTEIETNTYAIKQTILDLQKRGGAFSRQLLELNVKQKEISSTIKITIAAKQNTKTPIQLSYIIADAGWNAVYDVRIKDTNAPLQLLYKAQVYQNTDEDWEKVQLNLSTGNPSINSNKPDLDTYYLTFDNFYNRRKAKEVEQSRIKKDAKSGNYMISGRVTDAETGEGIAFATITVVDSQFGSQTDFDGYYELTVPPSMPISSLSCAFVGYETREKIVKSNIINFQLKEQSEVLEQVIVSAYKMPLKMAGVTSGRKKKRKSKPQPKKQIPLAIQQQPTTTTFKIDIPYSIPSDNQTYDVTMVEYEVPAQYHYACVPKMSTDAYLIAQLTDWTDYHLLDGDAHLFYQGIFQGKTFIDVQSVEDTLSLSIGRDPAIVVEREIEKDFSKKQFIGSNKKELRAWTISLKNTKDHAVKVIVEDQYPLSKESDIKVEQIEDSGAKVEESTGKLTWTVPLAAKGSKELLLKYEVKYPKNRNLLVE